LVETPKDAALSGLMGVMVKKSSKESRSMRFGNHFEWAETCPSGRLLRFQYQTNIGGSIGIRKWFKASKDVLQ
jgi:hypothetical protein